MRKIQNRNAPHATDRAATPHILLPARVRSSAPVTFEVIGSSHTTRSRVAATTSIVTPYISCVGKKAKKCAPHIHEAPELDEARWTASVATVMNAIAMGKARETPDSSGAVAGEARTRSPVSSCPVNELHRLTRREVDVSVGGLSAAAKE